MTPGKVLQKTAQAAPHSGWFAIELPRLNRCDES